ncbi:MAG: tetratricopeptide repeat protein [Actinomycetota bacterium]
MSTHDDAQREERRFLLDSLRDLERERQAGDIDEHDFETLRDDYTARVALLTKQLDAKSGRRSDAGNRFGRRAVTVLVVVLLGLAAGWFVADNSGQRLPGQSATGGIEQSTATLLSQARLLNFNDPAQAITLYTEVLKIEPDNPEALTYRSWLLALSSREASEDIKKVALATALTDITRAIEVDNTYTDAFCLLGIINFRFLDDAELAKPPLDKCLAGNPPHEVLGLVNSIVDQVNAAVEGK